MNEPTYWPPSNNDVSGKRLQRSLAECKATQAIGKHYWDELGSKFDELLTNDQARQLIAAVVLKISEPEGKDRPLTRAFTEAGLDHGNPLHWRVLIDLLAGAHFGPRLKRTADPDRAAKSLSLFQQAYDINKAHNLDWNMTAIAKKLCQKERISADEKIEAKRKKLEAAYKFVSDTFVGRFPGMPLTNQFLSTELSDGRNVGPNLLKFLLAGERRLSDHLESKTEKKPG